MSLRFEPESKRFCFELFHQGRGLEDPRLLAPSIPSIHHVCQAGASSGETVMNDPESLPWRTVQTSGRDRNKNLNYRMKKETEMNTAEQRHSNFFLSQ